MVGGFVCVGWRKRHPIFLYCDSLIHHFIKINMKTLFTFFVLMIMFVSGLFSQIVVPSDTFTVSRGQWTMDIDCQFQQDSMGVVFYNQASNTVDEVYFVGPKIDADSVTVYDAGWVYTDNGGFESSGRDDAFDFFICEGVEARRDRVQRKEYGTTVFFHPGVSVEDHEGIARTLISPNH